MQEWSRDVSDCIWYDWMSSRGFLYCYAPFNQKIESFTVASRRRWTRGRDKVRGRFFWGNQVQKRPHLIYEGRGARIAPANVASEINVHRNHWVLECQVTTAATQLFWVRARAFVVEPGQRDGSYPAQQRTSSSRSLNRAASFMNVKSYRSQPKYELSSPLDDLGAKEEGQSKKKKPTAASVFQQGDEPPSYQVKPLLLFLLIPFIRQQPVHLLQ